MLHFLLKMLKYMKYFKKNVDNGLLMDQRKHTGVKKRATQFLHIVRDEKFFERAARRWVQTVLFYIGFYILLSSIFAFCMWIVILTLNPRRPKWTLDESLIGTNPGLGFRPMPQLRKAKSTLIWYKVTDRESYKYWVKNLEDFLEVYKNPILTPGRKQNIYKCDYNRPPGPGQVCDVDIRRWDPCTLESDFNYHKASPCFFLKLNNIYGWIPECYNSTIGLPEQMPAPLKNHIANISISKPHEMNTVWVTCEGENPVDIENLGTVYYIPRQGFPWYFYPYENSEGYLSPIVAIHIANPKRGIIINIECRAWAKNIKHNRQLRLGSVHLELLID